MSVIDVTAEILDFPITTRCPVCSELSLNIYEDTPRSDLWLACTNCPAHGNIITFASAYWKLNTLDALAKFKELGVNTRELSPDNMRELTRHAKTIHAADHFWTQAAGQLWTHTNDILTLKFRDFGLSPEIPCFGLAGIATTAQIAEMCKAIKPAYPKKLRNNIPVLVLPYCDLPRHYSGFLLLQYLEEFEVRRTFISLHGRLNLHIKKIDAGYYMLEPAVLAKNKTVTNSIFIVDDPLWVLKAQTTQLRHGSPFLPICASYDDKECATFGGTWGGMSNQRKFFYSSRITPNLVSQAANAPGYVCALKKEGLEKPVRPAGTIKTLEQLFRSAVTWQKTLTQIFERSDEITANNFFTKLTVPADKLRNFLVNSRVVPLETADELMARVTPTYLTSTETTHYSTAVLIREDSWYTAGNVLITNCAPFIEKIIHTDDNKYYVGHVKKQNKIVPFQEEAKTVDNIGLLAYAERLLAANGEHVVFTPYWNRRSHITAMALRPPEVINIRSKPGWDETTKEFYTADYAINTDGVIRAMPYTDLRVKTAFKLPEPGLFPPPSIYALLGPASENTTVWPIVASAIANMLAPVADKDVQSVAVTNDIFLATNQIFKAINLTCREFRTVSKFATKAFLGHVNAGSWPQTVFTYYKSDQVIELALARHPNTAATLKISPATIAAALSYGWQVITGTPPAANLDYSGLPYIVAGYLQHALRGRARTLRNGKNLTLAVLRDLHNWLAETYNNSFNLAQAEKGLLLPGSEIIYLMRVINDAILANEIDVLPAQRKKRQNWNYIIRDNESWWLNQRAIDNYFKNIGAVKPNWLAIADCFAQHDLLNGEKIIYQITGLLVKKEWCDKFWTNYGETTNRNIG